MPSVIQSVLGLLKLKLNWDFQQCHSSVENDGEEIAERSVNELLCYPYHQPNMSLHRQISCSSICSDHWLTPGSVSSRLASFFTFSL